MQLLSDVAFTIDGVPTDIARTLNYKGMMFSDVPNLASSFGYTNASWTLKADLTAGYVCRLLNTMKARKVRQATPRIGNEVGEETFLDFTSRNGRSEEHTSELQSLMHLSYAVFCLKKKNKTVRHK